MPLHLIADDLGLDQNARGEPAEQTGPTWLDIEDVMLERGMVERLRRESIIDDIEADGLAQ